MKLSVEPLAKIVAALDRAGQVAAAIYPPCLNGAARGKLDELRELLDDAEVKAFLRLSEARLKKKVEGKMTKVIRIGLGLLTFLAAVFVLADSPHCQKCSDSVGDQGALIVAYDVAGLGGETVANWTLTASLEGHARCKNGGDNCPSAANKFGPVEQGAQGTFSVHNGRAKGTIALPAGITLSCPGGQTPTLLDVEWTDIVLTVDGTVVFTDDSISRIFAACGK